MSWTQELFGLDLGDLPVNNRALASWQQPSPDRGVGCSPISAAAPVVASPAFVDHLIEIADREGIAVSATVALGPEHAEYGPNPLGAERERDLLHYRLVVGRPGVDPQPIVAPTLTAGPFRPQPGRMAEPIGAPTGDRFIWGVGHWPDLLVANLLALQAATGEIDDNEISPSAEIHPTAVVERSRIGARTTIGPFAVVRDAIVGEGCDIAEHTSVSQSNLGPETTVQTGALVHGSVVGETTVVSFQVAVRGSVLFGSSTISAPVVVRSVVGRDVFLSRGVSIGASTLTDTTISIRRGRRSVDTGLRLLGSVIGNGARIGNGIQLPAGYEVPAERYLAARPIPRQTDELPTRTPLAPTDRGFRAMVLRPTDTLTDQPTEGIDR